MVRLRADAERDLALFSVYDEDAAPRWRGARCVECNTYLAIDELEHLTPDGDPVCGDCAPSPDTFVPPQVRRRRR